MTEIELKLMQKRIAIQMGEQMAIKITLNVLLLSHPQRQLLRAQLAEATREMVSEFSKALQDTLEDPESAKTALESCTGVMEDMQTILSEDQQSD